jgi:hypothetical protein
MLTAHSGVVPIFVDELAIGLSIFAAVTLEAATVRRNFPHLSAVYATILSTQG